MSEQISLGQLWRDLQTDEGPCSDCEGTGHPPGLNTKCSACNGTGNPYAVAMERVIEAAPALIFGMKAALSYIALVDTDGELSEEHLAKMFAAKDELRAALRKVRL